MKEAIRQDIRNNLKQKIQKKYNINSLKELNGYQNFIYEGELNNKKYIFRISHISHRNKIELEEELRFISLLDINEVPVSKAVILSSYEYVEEIKSEKETYYLCVFEKAKGVTWREKNHTDMNFFNAGRALGKLHKTSKTTEKEFNRKSWSENQYLQITEKVIPDKNILNSMNELINKLNSLPKTNASYGLIHGDYLFSNLIYNNDEITIIDFDECEYSWFVYDIAVYLFYYILGGNPKDIDIESNQDLFKKFISGYIQENEIDMFWIEKLPDFLRLREFVLLSSIYRSFNLDSLGKWEKDYIEVAENRIKNNIPFVDIDFKSLFNVIES